MGNMLIKRAKMSITQELDEKSTVSLSFKGEGDGVLTVTRVALVPTERGTVVSNIRESMCASFKANNLLELNGEIKKTLSRKACLGIPNGK